MRCIENRKVNTWHDLPPVQCEVVDEGSATPWLLSKFFAVAVCY